MGLCSLLSVHGSDALATKLRKTEGELRSCVAPVLHGAKNNNVDSVMCVDYYKGDAGKLFVNVPFNFEDFSSQKSF